MCVSLCKLQWALSLEVLQPAPVVAAYRAVQSQEDAALFHDHMAEALAGPSAIDQVTQHSVLFTTTAAFICAARHYPPPTESSCLKVTSAILGLICAIYDLAGRIYCL